MIEQRSKSRNANREGDANEFKVAFRLAGKKSQLVGRSPGQLLAPVVLPV